MIPDYPESRNLSFGGLNFLLDCVNRNNFNRLPNHLKKYTALIDIGTDEHNRYKVNLLYKINRVTKKLIRWEREEKHRALALALALVLTLTLALAAAAVINPTPLINPVPATYLPANTNIINPVNAITAPINVFTSLAEVLDRGFTQCSYHLHIRRVGVQTIGNSGSIAYEARVTSLIVTRIRISDPYNQLQMGYNAAGGRQPFAQNLADVLLSIRYGGKHPYVTKHMFYCMPDLGPYLYQAIDRPWSPQHITALAIGKNLINALMS